MAEKVEECDLNNLLFLEKFNIKKELKDDNCYIDVSETTVSANDTELKDNIRDDGIKECKIANTVDDTKIEFSPSQACNIVINDNVKIENEFNPDDIKIEYDNKLSFCDHCNEHYEDYCTRCGMLAHILNGITLSITNGRAIKGIPTDILEIRESSGHVGVFALKVIPEDVKMGPFSGLRTSEFPRRLKGGKLMVLEDKPNVLNWMQYINLARNIFQQNLIPFQREDNLYYHSNREILVGEELLVYFGEEYEDCVNKDIEMDFIAPTEDDVTDVFACALCCLGFSSRGHLVKHKTTCPNETNRRSSISKLTQCPFCNIYFYEDELLECHKPYCCETNVRKCISLALDNQTVEVNRRKIQRFPIYKCTQCKYKTSYKSDLRSHFNKHYEVKMYRCEICSRQFKTKESLKLHVKYIHIDAEGKGDQKCSMRDYVKANTKGRRYSQNTMKKCPNCKFQTKYKYYLKIHVKTKHLKEYSYDCELCDYKTNHKQNLERHIRTKHLKEVSFECEICCYKTNQKQDLERHIKSKHLKEFSYECDICDYKTNHKQNLQRHISKHLKQFSYNCEICDYKTIYKENLEKHIKSKHLKQFSYKCEICDYETNHKPNLEKHRKSIHLKEFTYQCEICDYKTNKKSNLEIHVKTNHLKEFSFGCEICNYKTNHKQNLEIHITSKHLKKFSYECEKCDFKTNQKSNLERHIKSKHLKQFSYECEICDYKINQKSRLEAHVKSIHLKEFSYECEICDYKTNYKPALEIHVKSKHLKQFSYECDICNYKTNQKLSFEIHVKSKHLKEFNYKCELCDFKTNRKSHFKTHVKSKHLIEFSRKCDICDYKTNLKSTLDNHIKSKHLKEFNYKCKICDYKLKTKPGFDQHMKRKHQAL